MKKYNVGIVGYGWVTGAHIEAIMRVRPIAKVHAFDLDAAISERFARASDS